MIFVTLEIAENVQICIFAILNKIVNLALHGHPIHPHRIRNGLLGISATSSHFLPVFGAIPTSRSASSLLIE